MTTEAQVRKLQDTLVVVGQGIVAFGVWAFAKTVGLLVLYDEATLRELLGLPAAIRMSALYALIGIIAIVDLLVRALVGRAAIREGRGEGRGHLYLIIALAFAISHGVAIYYTLQGLGIYVSDLDRVATITMDASSLVTLLLMVYAALNLRRIERAGERV